MQLSSTAGLVSACAVATLAVAACGGSTSPRVATAAGSANAAGATTTVFDGDRAFVDYARCMRANGVSDFPDPVQRPGHNGLSLQYNGDPSMDSFQAADRVCKHIIAPIVQEKEAHAHDGLTPGRMAGLTAYARCMRDHGIPVKDPDPTDGHLSLDDSLGFGADIGRKDPVFHRSDAACRSLLPADVNDDGTGPP